MPIPQWKRYVYATIAAEISSLTRYYDRVVEWMRPKGDTGALFDAIVAPEKVTASDDFPLDLRGETDRRTAILLNGTFNLRADIQQLLQRLRRQMARTSRVIAVVYNPYYAIFYRLAFRMGLKAGENPTTFVTYNDLRNIVRLAGFELVRIRPAVYLPGRFLGIAALVNRIMPIIPLFRHLGLVSVVTLRPTMGDAEDAAVSVIVPARNERDNIRALLARLPQLPPGSEVLFVEGNSTDGTWEEIQRAVADGKEGVALSAFQQPGRGKNDAVRVAIGKASCELVTILDADLSVPPEDLPLFYEAYRNGHGDFINGTRLVYPMESSAMQFLNRLANVFFAKALTFTLDVRLTDALCGTKLATRHDLRRIAAWRGDFGDFDPFGDFELLFPAAILGLGIVDVPIRYRARSYGETNIRRFRDGFRLLGMTAVALFRVKSGRGAK